MTAKTRLGAAGVVAAAALGVLGLTWVLDSDTAPPPPSAGDRAPLRDNRATNLRDCVARWNGPANSKQRAVLNRAAVAEPSVSSAVPGGVPLENRVLVLRYSGPPLEDVGVGETGVNASRGDCLVAHPSNVLFLYTDAAWHQVGHSPGLAFEGIPQRATSSPNAVIVVRKPAAGPDVDAGRI